MYVCWACADKSKLFFISFNKLLDTLYIKFLKWNVCIIMEGGVKECMCITLQCPNLFLKHAYYM